MEPRGTFNILPLPKVWHICKSRTPTSLRHIPSSSCFFQSNSSTTSNVHRMCNKIHRKAYPVLECLAWLQMWEGLSNQWHIIGDCCTQQATSDAGTASVELSSRTASRDGNTAADSTSAATRDVNDDVSSHPLLVDQPEAVRQLVSAMMAKWNARANDVTSAPTVDDGAVQLDVLEVDGDLASSVMPQVRVPLINKGKGKVKVRKIN